MPWKQTARMLSEGRTPFGRHEVFSHAKLGQLLSEEFELQKRTAEKAAAGLVQKGVFTPEGANELVEKTPPPEVFKLERQIHAIEKLHKQKLVELAKDTVCELYGISREQLDSLFAGGRVELEDAPIENEFEERPAEKLTERVKRWIARRHVHNLLISGWAINHMRAAPIMAGSALAEIDARLPDLHALHSALAQLLNIKSLPIMQSMGAPPLVAGKFKLEWVGGKPRASARAVTFPILVQEISKAVVESAFAHGLPQAGKLTQQEIAAFHNHTNDPAAEIFHFVVGPPAAALLGKAIGFKDVLSHLAAFSLFPKTDLERHVTKLLDAHGNPGEVEARGRNIRRDTSEVHRKWVDGEEFEV